MVRGSHHHTHLISSLQVLWVVGIESPSPHGRPEVVAFQSKNQFKHFFIELMPAVVRTESILNPCRETGGLIIQEKTTITHGRLTIGIFTFLYIERSMLLYWHIGPVIPGRDTDLLRQFIDTIHCSTLITARNHQLTTDGLDDIFLGLTFQVGQFTLLHPLVYLLITSHCTYQHLDCLIGESAFLTRHLLKISQEVASSQLHTTMLTLTQTNSHLSQLPCVCRGLECNKTISRSQMRNGHHTHQEHHCSEQNKSSILHRECYKLYNLPQS